MTAGLNMRARIWRLVEQPDDDYGGAILSGTVLYDSVDVRMTALKPSALLLQQGLEVDSLFRMMVPCSERDYREYDEVEVIWPTQHKYYLNLFRIIKIQEDSLHPFTRKSFDEFILSKLKYSRSGNLGEA